MKIKLLLTLSLFSADLTTAMCQISGTINTYTKVTAVDYLCNFITVNSTAGFAAGDKVLLIQMQGATINQTNSASFGDITAIGDAGNYEFALIDHFSGNDVYFSKTLLRTYTPSGSVQMISVPQYTTVSIEGELTAKSWDGNTGGVIVFESSDVVTLNANINTSEQGFRGGEKSSPGGDCLGAAAITYSFPTAFAGQKGEGISNYISGKESGRGKNSTGGGGGGSHNTGGAGGANYGSGGRGGDKTSGCSNPFYPNPYGFSGYGLGTTYYNSASNKIFMGGGGGGGQQNNRFSYNGGNGGGIIILKAPTLNTNGFTIRSNGGSVASYYNTAAPTSADNGDGNSGGGAGGTVLLHVQTYSAPTLVEVIGGKGGDTGYLNSNFGPGGGGGGGVVWSSTSPGTAIRTTLSEGNAGISGTGPPNYGAGNSYNAANGTAGALLSSLSIPESSSTSNCALPVELLSFQAKAMGKYSIQLNWSTATELNNHFFTLEKSTDGIHFFPVTKLYGEGNTHQLTNYTYLDEVQAYELLYYKLWQTDIDGHAADLGIRKVYPAYDQHPVLTVYPNPCRDELFLELNTKKESVKSLALVNAYGDLSAVTCEEKENGWIINTASIPSGLYSLILYFSNQSHVVKVIKE